MNKLIKKFKALSDETRLRMVNILLERECCVCEVMEALQISQTRASRNLNILYDAGFLKMRRDGIRVVYSMDNDMVNEYYLCLVQIINKELNINEMAVSDKNRLIQIDSTRIGCV